MSKELHEMSFDELVKMGVQRELDAIVSGEKLASRVYQIMELACYWRMEQSKKQAASTTKLRTGVQKANIANDPLDGM